MKLFTILFFTIASFLFLPLLAKENKTQNMQESIKKLFPKAKLLKSNSNELQYMVTANKNSFWLCVPQNKNINNLNFIFVFSGRGGTGKNNNINAKGIPETFRINMLKNNFAFICAVCSPNAWGNLESTKATLAAINYCKKQGINLKEKVDLLGFSMGGLGALMFAARHPNLVNKVVDVFGITNLEKFYQAGFFKSYLSKIPASERKDASPQDKINQYKNIKFLIIHGNKDTTVPMANSQDFYLLLQKANIDSKLIIVPNIGHSNNILGKTGKEIEMFFKQ